MEILKSASKIVLLLFAFTVAISVVYLVLSGKVGSEQVIEIFKSSVLLVLGFYFANKGDQNKPYAGK